MRSHITAKAIAIAHSAPTGRTCSAVGPKEISPAPSIRPRAENGAGREIPFGTAPSPDATMPAPERPTQTFAPHFPQNVAPGASGEPQFRHVIWAGGAGPAGGGAPPDGGGCHGCWPYGGAIIGWSLSFRTTR